MFTTGGLNVPAGAAQGTTSREIKRAIEFPGFDIEFEVKLRLTGGERLVEQFLFVGGVREGLSECVSGGGHFLPALLQDADHFNVGGFAGEVAKLALEENEAKRVFQDPRFGVVGKVLL